MPPLSRKAFVRALRGLSCREFEAFVADLWAARGFETAVEDGVVVAVQSGERRRLGVHHGAGWLARFAPGPSHEAVDAVVTSGAGDSQTPGDVTTIDAGALREMALYAIDRAECERLFRRHLGRPVAAAADDEPAVPLTGSGAVAVVAVALLLVAGVGGFGPPTAPQSSTANVTPVSTDSVPSPADVTTGEPTAPSVRVSGFESADRLASAHAQAVDGQSRRWSLTFRAYRNGHLVKQKRQTVWLRNASVYRSTTEWWSGEGIGPEFRGNASTYANGTVAFERFREGNATMYARFAVDRRSPPFAEQPAALVRRYLAVDGSRVVTATSVDDALGYRIVATGAILSNSTPGTTTAEVTRAGVVRQLRTEYRSFEGLTVVVTFRLDDVGTATVTAPTWLEQARQETAG